MTAATGRTVLEKSQAGFALEHLADPCTELLENQQRNYT